MRDRTDVRVRRFRRRILQLAPRVTTKGFGEHSPADFLNIQIEIGRLQREIQKSINAVRRERLSRDDALELLQDLKNLRWHSRRLGDSIAWIVLLWDRKTIASLSNNARVRVSSKETFSSAAVEVAANVLMHQARGLPIIHDITDCLRIGDVTILNFGDTVDDRRFTTVELKSHRLNSELHADGSETVQVRVEMIANSLFTELISMPGEASQISGDPEPTRVFREDRRLQRQIDRMTAATEYRDAADNVLTKVSGGYHMSLVSPTPDDHHWLELRRAIREARETGYAFFTIDRYVAYAVYFNRAGITKGNVQIPAFAEDVRRFLRSSTGQRKSLIVSQIPVKESDSRAPNLLPFFLYDIPRRAVRELVEGKLTVVGLLNTGTVEDALTSNGFTVVPVDEDNEKKGARPFHLRTTLAWPEGSLEIEMSAPWNDMWQGLHEFLGLENIVEKSKLVRDIPKSVTFSEFQNVWSTSGR